MPSALPDHYATLGLDRRCTDAQIRTAYRLLSKQHHPDVNGGSPASVAKAQDLNAACLILTDPARRRDYDRELAARQKSAARTSKPMPNITKDIHLRIDEFLHGTQLEVRVNEPANSTGLEVFELTVPPDTAPGTRFRQPRHGGGFITVRVKVRPDFRFKVHGSDLRCDLKINFQRAQQGGTESVRSVTGSHLRVPIPPKVTRGEIIRIAGEGLPKLRGGRGELHVRILYVPEVQIRRTRNR